MNTETILKTTMGKVQYFQTEHALLSYYNRDANLYEIRNIMGDGKRLYHKGHARYYGIVETIPARESANA